MSVDWNQLYKMKLGEIFIPDSNLFVRRVPGGWVYVNMQGVCFVPITGEGKNHNASHSNPDTEGAE